MENRTFVHFKVGDFNIWRVGHDRIPTHNRNYVHAVFAFADSWAGLNATAIFSTNTITPIYAPIVDGICKIPNEMMERSGVIQVSVFASDRKTVDVATISVIESGYTQGECAKPTEPLAPENVFVQSPNIPQIREEDGKLEYFTGGKWNRVDGAGDLDAAKILAKIQEVRDIADNKQDIMTPITNARVQEIINNTIGGFLK